MTTRRAFLQVAAATVALGLSARAAAQPALPEALVYLANGCGCCHGWLDHMRASGFRVKAITLDDVGPMKRQLGVPAQLHSCHTALIGGYVIEGHVPARDVKRLMRERSAKGLAVPGMVIGSPGMEGGAPKPYATIAFDDRGTRIFQQH